MASIGTAGLTIEEIQDLQEQGWTFVALYSHSAGVDTYLGELLFKPLPAKGEYIELPNDSVAGRQVSYYLHPYNSEHDVHLFIGQYVHQVFGKEKKNA